MNSKTKKELGFSMNEIDDYTILIEGVVQKNVSKKSQLKRKREFSKILLHLYDKEYVERLQQIELEIIDAEPDSSEKFLEVMNRLAKILMK